MTEFVIPTMPSFPYGIANGPDGNLWFAESFANKIGRITPLGAISEFVSPTPSSFPTAITAGPDGALWFTEQSGNKIGRISTGTAAAAIPVLAPWASLCLAAVFALTGAALLWRS
jgi:virginiamycin B lyase